MGIRGKVIKVTITHRDEIVRLGPDQLGLLSEETVFKSFSEHPRIALCGFLPKDRTLVIKGLSRGNTRCILFVSAPHRFSRIIVEVTSLAI
ncbi:hypothetical protein [Paenibacillus aceris]|uniref:Uncharacterized protein n=1 Tax=Paenibacillus aceris TaxID=869555 RepID=A0ABS4HQE6_9BACL|nr:hypothetical protein [Paenibacillus aceris]MBP1960823.1 hypothetical protein [Paenibacillus aceris]NHW35498.1 hypothetical protein [Paenibacillus aceris]